MSLKTWMQESDKAFYSASVHYYDPKIRTQFDSHVAAVSNYLDAVVSRFQKHIEGRDNFHVLELGAGTCLTTLMIRKRFPNARLTCLDISLSRMQVLLEDSAKLLGVHHREIE